jgi:hypothetical protein
MANTARLIAALLLLSACGQTPAGERLRLAAATLPHLAEPEPPGPSLLLEGPRRVVLVPISGNGAR